MTGSNLIEHFVEINPNRDIFTEDGAEKRFITSIEVSPEQSTICNDNTFMTSLFDTDSAKIHTENGKFNIKLHHEQNGKYIFGIKIGRSNEELENFDSLCDLKIGGDDDSQNISFLYKLEDLQDVSSDTFYAISDIKVLKVDGDSLGDKTFSNYKETYRDFLSGYTMIEEEIYRSKDGKRQYILYETTEYYTETLKPVIKTYTFSPELSSVYPSKEIDEKLGRSIAPINNLVTTFIAPYGLKFETDKISKDSFIMQNFLTDQTGQEFYMTTLIFYEKFEWVKKSSNGVIQKAYTIISKVPAFKMFSEVLYFVFNNPILRDSTLYPFYFTTLYTKNNIMLAFPAIGNLANDEDNTEKPLELVFESELSFPFANQIDFSLIFSFVSLENICKLLTILLLEKSILLTSYNENLLTPIIESLKILMYPFEWQFSVIPMLEQTMEVLLDAPIPLLIGIKGDIDYIRDRVVFNLETGKFKNVDNGENNDTSLNLFKPYTVELAEDLRLGGLYYNIESLRLVEVQNFSETGCRMAFLRAFINMLGLSLLDSLLFPSLDEKEGSKNGYFELCQLLAVEKYKNERLKNIKKLNPPVNWGLLFSEFINTDCFYRLIYNCSFPKNEPLYFFTSDNYTNLFKVCSVKEKMGKRSCFRDIMTKEFGFTSFNISSLEDEFRMLRISFDKNVNTETNLLKLDASTIQRLREYFEIRSNRKTKYLVFSKTSRNLINDIIEYNPRTVPKPSFSAERRESLNSVVYYGTNYRPTKDIGVDKKIIDILKYYEIEYHALLGNMKNKKEAEHFLKFRRDTANVVVIIWLIIANGSRSIQMFERSYNNKTKDFEAFFIKFMNIFTRLKITPSKVIMELFLSIVNVLNDPMYIARTCGTMKKFNIPISRIFYKKNLSISRLSLARPAISNSGFTPNKNTNDENDKKDRTSNNVVFKVGKLCKCGFYIDWLTLITNFVTEYYALVKCPNCSKEFIPYIDVMIGRKQMNVLLFTPLLVLQTILEDVDIKGDIIQLKKSIYSNNEETIFKKNKHKITNSKTLINHNTQLYYNVAIYLVTFGLPTTVLSSANFEMTENRTIKETDEDLDFMLKIEKALTLDNLEGALVFFLSMRRLKSNNSSIFNNNMFKTFVNVYKKSKNEIGFKDFKQKYNRKIKDLPSELQKYVYYNEIEYGFDIEFVRKYFSQL